MRRSSSAASLECRPCARSPFQPGPAALEEADGLLAGIGSPFVVLALGAMSWSKRLGLEVWIGLGRAILEERLAVVLLGAQGEDQERAGLIVQALPEVHDLTGRASLAVAAGVIRRVFWRGRQRLCTQPPCCGVRNSDGRCLRSHRHGADRPLGGTRAGRPQGGPVLPGLPAGSVPGARASLHGRDAGRGSAAGFAGHPPQGFLKRSPLRASRRPWTVGPSICQRPWNRRFWSKCSPWMRRRTFALGPAFLVEQQAVADAVVGRDRGVVTRGRIAGMDDLQARSSPWGCRVHGPGGTMRRPPSRGSTTRATGPSAAKLPWKPGSRRRSGCGEHPAAGSLEEGPRPFRRRREASGTSLEGDPRRGTAHRPAGGCPTIRPRDGHWRIGPDDSAPGNPGLHRCSGTRPSRHLRRRRPSPQHCTPPRIRCSPDAGSAPAGRLRRPGAGLREGRQGHGRK